MKKIFALGVIGIITTVIFTSCGDEKSANDSSIKLGCIEHLNLDEDAGNSRRKEIHEKIEQLVGYKIPPHELKFFPNLNSMQMSIESEQIDEIGTYQPVANYLMAKNPNFEVVAGHTPKEVGDNFCFAFRTEDAELKADTDHVITEMKADGTLDKLIKTYITDLKADEEPPTVAFETFRGAETITVAVTGDLPPFDLVLPSGKAAGFNTAVLSELGKRLQKNIEVIQVESAARAATLISKKSDIVFWAIIPQSDAVLLNIIPANVDKPEGVELSIPYYRSPLVHVGLKK